MICDLVKIGCVFIYVNVKGINRYLCLFQIFFVQLLKELLNETNLEVLTVWC